MCRYGLRERSIQTGRSNINTRKPVYKHSASGVRLCRVFVLLKVALRPQRLILTFIKETAERASAETQSQCTHNSILLSSPRRLPHREYAERNTTDDLPGLRRHSGGLRRTGPSAPR